MVSGRQSKLFTYHSVKFQKLKGTTEYRNINLSGLPRRLSTMGLLLQRLRFVRCGLLSQLPVDRGGFLKTA